MTAENGVTRELQEASSGPSSIFRRTTKLDGVAASGFLSTSANDNIVPDVNLNDIQQTTKAKRKRRKTSSGKITLTEPDNANLSTIHKAPSSIVPVSMPVTSSPPVHTALDEILVPNSSPLPIIQHKNGDEISTDSAQLPSDLIVLASDPNTISVNQNVGSERAMPLRPPNFNLFQQPKSSRINGEEPAPKRKYTKRKDKAKQTDISPQGVVQLQLNPSPSSIRLQAKPVVEILVKKSLIQVLRIQKDKLQSCLSDIEQQKQLRKEETIHKPVHPFFNNKKSQTTKTAGKSDHETNNIRSEGTDETERNAFLKFAILGPKTVNSTNSFGPKLQPAVDPPWPVKGSVHVRGDLEDNAFCEELKSIKRKASIFETTRKNKYKPPTIADEDSVLATFSRRQLAFRNPSQQQTGGYENDHGIPLSLRVPYRFEASASILLKEHLRPLLMSRMSSPSIHPALKTIRDRISNCEKLISPFDMGQCETQLWTVKYAPITAEEVLQPGKEAIYLRDWLGRMKVWAVESGVSSERSEKKGSRGKKDLFKKKKKRKRPEGLDGFVVSEDEDDGTMDEITDPEDEISLRSNTLKSVIRHGVLASINVSGDDSSDLGGIAGEQLIKLMNTVVISGPSGVGKTAAIYAAAHEHGFTVFEIHPGMKRGGKEVLEMVGDMSRNHLVHQAKEREHESKSEKVKPVKSFFKTSNTEVSNSSDGVQDIKKTVSSNQQQSLILIEEADLLYEDDKQFWTTVLSLITRSKRPVIITCNDESLLPLDSLPLHAIFRFAKPPVDLTIDYLLLIAAAEGHILQRETATSLYRDCQGDIRQCIMQLDFWCQMTVGDRTGGMKWWVKRWPPGIDQDEDGEILRCFSKDTFLPGMGAIGRDLLFEQNALYTQKVESSDEIIWRDIYESTGLDVGEKLFWNMDDLLEDFPEKTNSQDFLATYERFVDAMSAVDVYAGKEIRDSSPYENYQSLNIILDPTQKSLTLKDASDNIVGLKVLQIDPIPVYTSTERSIAMYVRSVSCNLIHNAICSTVDSNVDEIPRPHSSMSNLDKFSDLVLDKDKVRPYEVQLPKHLLLPLEYLSQLDIPFATTPIIGHSQILRSTRTVLTEVAPYVREIARHDIQVEEHLKATSTLLSEGGNGKRKRTTRAAALAAEGRGRGSGRRNAGKYLKGNIIAIAATAGNAWAQASKNYTPPMPEDDDEEEHEESAEEENESSLQEIENESGHEATRIDQILDSSHDASHIPQTPSDLPQPKEDITTVD